MFLFFSWEGLRWSAFDEEKGTPFLLFGSLDRKIPRLNRESVSFLSRRFDRKTRRTGAPTTTRTCVRVMAHVVAPMGAVRSRTAVFRRYREASRATRALFEPSSVEHEALLPGRNTTDQAIPGRTTSLPPPWVDASEALAEDMVKIRGMLDELPKLHARALRASFDDDSAGAPQVQADNKAREITRALHNCEGRLRGLRSLGNQEEDAVKKNVQAQAAQQLQKLSIEFRKAQKNYLLRLKKQAEGSSRNFVPGLEPTREERIPEDDGFIKAEAMVEQANTAMIREREREIEAVAQSVEDLAMVMKDLSTLVIDQGSVLDRIDYNIEQVGSHVEEGLEQLRKAERSQKRSRMTMCILLLVGAILFMLVLLILKNLIFL